MGALAGLALVALLPGLGVDPRIAALVGMAAIFAGASRALLASVVFAFETTHQAAGLLPLLGGCSAAYLVSALTMRNTIMTEKIARRGVRVPTEYAADYLEQVLVRDACTREVVSLPDEGRARRRAPLDPVRPRRGAARGIPVVDDTGRVRGLVTRRMLLDPSEPGNRRIGELPLRPPMVVHEHHSLREAADHMVAENVGRLIVVGWTRRIRSPASSPAATSLSRTRRLKENREARRHIRWRASSRRAAEAEANR